jgi:hypothetical protein
MAINDDTDYPRLTPPDDSYPSPGNLFRSADDLTDDQFDLLAAAWSENALPDDSLAEMEALFSSSPAKKAYAEIFGQLYLSPIDDEWKGKNALLRTTPAVKILRRVYIVTLAAAAVWLALFTFRPFTEKQVNNTAPVSLPEVSAASESMEIVPPAVTNNIEEAAIVSMVTPVSKQKKEPNTADHNQAVKTTPVVMSAEAEIPMLIAGINSRELRSFSFNTTVAPEVYHEDDVNWIIKGISRLSGAVTKEEKPITGYAIASTFIEGINSVFGWEMGLEKAVGKDGKIVAVRFNSSLVSFSAPANKTSQ